MQIKDLGRTKNSLTSKNKAPSPYSPKKSHFCEENLKKDNFFYKVEALKLLTNPF